MQKEKIEGNIDSLMSEVSQKVIKHSNSIIGTFDVKDCSTCKYGGQYPILSKCWGWDVMDDEGGCPNWEEKEEL